MEGNALTTRSSGPTSRNIVVVGQTFSASRTTQRVSAMRQLGHNVQVISTMPAGVDYETLPSLMTRIRYRMRLPADPAGANDAILSLDEGVDVLWLETADMVRASTLERLKARYPKISIVWYSEDDMMNPRNRTIWLQRAIPLVDLWATTKSLNIRPAERNTLGFRQVIFVNNSYDPQVHSPAVEGNPNIQIYGSPISFIGTYEAPRAKSVLHLARSGLRVRVWGNGWESMRGCHQNLVIEGRPAYGDEFANVVAASPINLCFLRHANRDFQTCRSIELPACGGFMVHERNTEIRELLRESREAAYFSNDEELESQCRYWLGRGKERRVVAARGRRRVEELQLTHQANVSRIFNRLEALEIEQAK